MDINMNKFAVLIIVVALLLSGCGILHTVMTETGVVESQTEQTISESAQTTLQPAEATTHVPDVTSQTATETTTRETEYITTETEYSITLKRDILVLMIAYPDYVAGVEMIENEACLVMRSGKRILYDDKKTKTFDEKITDADIQDMLETIYPLTEINALMSTDVDPGRSRAYSFFEEIYGDSKAVISKKLVSVDFGDEHLPFNKEAGAAAALASAAVGAAGLVIDQPQIVDYLYPTSGTFNYRVIAGTNRLSPHAFGIAIDLRSSPDGYWRWASPAEGEKLIKKYPQDLVRLFEKNGFIWGGKWNHFDLFHFEYRPEIIIKAKYFAEEIDITKPWYQGTNFACESVSEIIAQIDRSLG
jgi:uncharacterized protein YceK